MHDELMAEVDKMSKEIKEQEKSKVIEILKEQDKWLELLEIYYG